MYRAGGTKHKQTKGDQAVDEVCEGKITRREINYSERSARENKILRRESVKIIQIKYS